MGESFSLELDGGILPGGFLLERSDGNKIGFSCLILVRMVGNAYLCACGEVIPPTLLGANMKQSMTFNYARMNYSFHFNSRISQSPLNYKQVNSCIPKAMEMHSIVLFDLYV